MGIFSIDLTTQDGARGAAALGGNACVAAAVLAVIGGALMILAVRQGAPMPNLDHGDAAELFR